MKRPLSIMWLGLRGFPNVQGGIETHAEHLCPQLSELGCEVTVIVRASYQPSQIGAEWHKVHFHPLWAPRAKGLEAIVHTFLGVLYAAVKRPDILHIQGIGPALMTPLARLLGLRVVVTHHGPDYDRQKWGKLAKAVLRLGEFCGMHFANRRIAISEVIRALVRRNHGEECVLIPNGVDLPDRHGTVASLDRFGLQPQRYVLLVSRLVPEKRHHDLIEAFALARLDGWKLALVGGADHPDHYTCSVREAARQTPGVVCTGFQTGEALNELYEHAGIFVLPSSHEGLPIALLEAMSYGLPAIASDIPANQEINCRDIDYFPVGDVHCLAALLKKRAAVAQEQGRRARLRHFVLKRYKWQDVAQRTFAIYAEILTDDDRYEPAHGLLKWLDRR
ncbi:glycosyltransferase family 4 protein [Noviherbaspirillum sedimenti]|uniref:Glycosyltransferase n=1 Tax=Noviherbaspirillum sedimenti TaxID=2320865 RepID=A0A3A3G0B6_9BURK|nr:glycosyltransferase family 4 protein [Noviherbaspirillum sedimenti]RJG01075.1 glycosyltransferase [Noviherbaspirillum sedimenti]